MGFDNIPHELRLLDRWVCWRLEERKGKLTKVPVNAKQKRDGTYGMAMSNNLDTWSSYVSAIECLTKDTTLSGIGFMLGDGFVGVDIDECQEDGVIAEHARDIISILYSFTEYSPSGQGMHVICKGKLPEGRRQIFIEREGKPNAHLGMYDERRFFCMTGNVLDDAHMDVEERTAELAVVHDKYINVKKQGKNAAKIDKNVNDGPVFANNSVFLSDDEIIEIALNAKNGGLFGDLMNGTWQGRYTSQSEADLGLCNLLAFYTGKDSGMMDRLFKRSGLMRPKWDEKHGEGGTYGQITISKAIVDCGEVYEQKKKREKKPLQEPPEIDTGFDELIKNSENEDDNKLIHIPGGVFINDGVYKKIRYTKETKETIILSNFILHPLKLIRFEHNSILTVEIISTTGKTYIRDIDIKHFTSLIPFKKALGELLVFDGKETELEGIKALILKEKYPEIEGIIHTGFFKKNSKWFFASSDRVVDEHMDNVENMTVLVTEGKSNILESESTKNNDFTELADTLFKFNKLGIAGVIIGWTASLFIREKLWNADKTKHPHLFVIGEAGSGKSETIENITMPILSMEKQPLAAGQITRFSAMKNAASSNFVPFIIGEYKPSKLADWILKEISEVLRNSYDRQEGQRGTTDQVLINYPYRAPVLLIGEGSPNHETAIKERAMQLFLSKRDSNPYKEGFYELKRNKALLERFGHSLLETSLKIDDQKLVKWCKGYYEGLTNIYDERIRNGIAVVCTGLSLIQKTFKDAGISINLNDVLKATTEQLALDIYDGQEPKSDIIHTLEFFDQLADMDMLTEGVHYKKIQGTDEIALCVPRIFSKAKEYCAKTRSDLQQQRDFMSQIKRHDCYVTDRRTVRLYDLGMKFDKPVSCLVINIKNLKADISTLNSISQKEEKSAIPHEKDDYNPFTDYKQ